MKKPLSSELLQKMNAYWRAANYLSVGQIYLYDNPLLKKRLKLEHVKPRLKGNWRHASKRSSFAVAPKRVVFSLLIPCRECVGGVECRRVSGKPPLR